MEERGSLKCIGGENKLKDWKAVYSQSSVQNLKIRNRTMENSRLFHLDIKDYAY